MLNPESRVSTFYRSDSNTNLFTQITRIAIYYFGKTKDKIYDALSLQLLPLV